MHHGAMRAFAPQSDASMSMSDDRCTGRAGDYLSGDVGDAFLEHQAASFLVRVTIEIGHSWLILCIFNCGPHTLLLNKMSQFIEGIHPCPINIGSEWSLSASIYQHLTCTIIQTSGFQNSDHLCNNL